MFGCYCNAGGVSGPWACPRDHDTMSCLLLMALLSPNPIIFHFSRLNYVCYLYSEGKYCYLSTLAPFPTATHISYNISNIDPTCALDMTATISICTTNKETTKTNTIFTPTRQLAFKFHHVLSLYIESSGSTCCLS